MTLRLVAHSPDPAHPDPIIAELRSRVAHQRVLIANLALDLREARMWKWQAALGFLAGGFLAILVIRWMAGA